MAKQKGPTAEDRAKVVRVALAGIAGGVELGEIAARLAPLHPVASQERCKWLGAQVPG